MNIRANEVCKIRNSALQKCMYCNWTYFSFLLHFFNVVFTLFSLSMLQTISHLKVLLHIFVGGVLGALFLDSGNNGSKTVSNLGYLFCCVVYLSYTTMLPAVIRCEFWLLCVFIYGFKVDWFALVICGFYKNMNKFKHKLK